MNSDQLIRLARAGNVVSGRIALRRRYLKAVQIDRTRALDFWAELQEGQWVSGDFYRGSASGLKNLRKGRLIYGR